MIKTPTPEKNRFIFSLHCKSAAIKALARLRESEFKREVREDTDRWQQERGNDPSSVFYKPQMKWSREDSFIRAGHGLVYRPAD